MADLQTFDLILFASGTFAAALVTGVAGFSFVIVAAAVWLHLRDGADRGLWTDRAGDLGLEAAPVDKASTAAAVFARRSDRRVDRRRTAALDTIAAPHWAHQHDGLHASAVQRFIDPDPFRAQSRDDDRTIARAQWAIANGCADQNLVCDGGRHAVRAAGRREHHCGPENLRLGGGVDDFGLAVDALQLRLAAAHRRSNQWRL